MKIIMCFRSNTWNVLSSLLLNSQPLFSITFETRNGNPTPIKMLKKRTKAHLHQLKIVHNQLSDVSELNSRCLFERESKFIVTSVKQNKKKNVFVCN